ncbi:Uncharacterised protein [Mycobacterium tuberculosis]|nr:Uncharacterised protein [Mycobacterium tuberculosis]
MTHEVVFREVHDPQTGLRHLAVGLLEELVLQLGERLVLVGAFAADADRVDAGERAEHVQALELLAVHAERDDELFFDRAG